MQRLRSLLVLTSWLIICTQATNAQGSSRSAAPTFTLPSQTDARITTFNEAHLSWLPQGRPHNQLLLFLPGTGGKPRADFPFAETAAQLGYHVIFLMYPDNLASQKKCSRSPDPEAYMKFRLAIIRGGVIGPHRRIAYPDSIQNRLIQLLSYLATKQSNCGWDQFLNAERTIDWTKVLVSGHSQGGGHAYVIAKFEKVARVIMFGSPKDYSFYFQRPAQGFDCRTRTPLDRFFAFNHMKDNGNGCTHDQQAQIFKQMGLVELGIANADKPSPSYNHAHIIYTDIELPNSNRFHGSVLNAKLPVCAPVWKYMLTESVK